LNIYYPLNGDADLPVVLFLLFFIITNIFWIFTTIWALKNKQKIPGRLFEYLFFLFLFFASYFLTWAASGVLEGPQVISRLSFMIACIISAIYTGYLHYIKKIYN